MKKLYSTLIMTMVLAGLFCSQVQAQSTTGKTYVGYAKYDDQIWEYDGLSLDFDAKVGCAILLTRDMIEPYIGGTITGMRVGWDTSTQTGSYEGFVRASFNGEDLTSSKATTVRYNYSSSEPGWNNLTLTKWEIPEDVDQLVVGFTTRLKKGVCAIPTLYPHDTPNSCYLWVEGDNDQLGNPRWVDMNDRGILPILLTIQDSKGEFNYVPVITSYLDNGVMLTDEASDCLVRIKNLGSQTISSVEVTSKQGEQTFSKRVSLSKAVKPGFTSGTIMLPLYCFHSGEVEVSITQVNNKEVSRPCSYVTNVIGIPSDVANKYTRRPLVEYYESENNYMSPRYYDEIVYPSLRSKLGKMTYVSQHLDDQFMTGDDDATRLALQLCDNDSSAVSIPCMTIDRAISTGNLLFQQNSAWNPMFSVLYDPYASEAYKAAIQRPTFVSVQASGKLQEDQATLSVEVNGDVAGGIMNAGEKPRVTVYLMERDVFSDSQIFWTDKEKEEHMGEYIHANVIREILSDLDGDEITDGGDFAKTYQTELDPTWQLENLYLVAFIHRDHKQGGKYMHVLNSCEGELDVTVGVKDLEDKTTQGNISLYDLTGRKVQGTKHGIYILNGKKILK
ncbi:MAG: Omp28-related outer membrane protein [Bacteroidaceae bacterium]|nr:Omp28-related outer membrane protein [Bacteroidaceae bacterium]